MERLEAKEGVILDRDGTPLTADPRQANPYGKMSGSAHIKVLNGGWLLGTALAIGVPLLLMAGFAFFGAVAVLFLSVWFLKSFFSLFRLPR